MIRRFVSKSTLRHIAWRALIMRSEKEMRPLALLKGRRNKGYTISLHGPPFSLRRRSPLSGARHLSRVCRHLSRLFPALSFPWQQGQARSAASFHFLVRPGQQLASPYARRGHAQRRSFGSAEERPPNVFAKPTAACSVCRTPSAAVNVVASRAAPPTAASRAGAAAARPLVVFVQLDGFILRLVVRRVQPGVLRLDARIVAGVRPDPTVRRRRSRPLDCDHLRRPGRDAGVRLPAPGSRHVQACPGCRAARTGGPPEERAAHACPLQLRLRRQGARRLHGQAGCLPAPAEEGTVGDAVVFLHVLSLVGVGERLLGTSGAIWF